MPPDRDATVLQIVTVASPLCSKTIEQQTALTELRHLCSLPLLVLAMHDLPNGVEC